MAATRRGYSALELKRIENCVKRGGNLRALAKSLNRNYDALWRFVKKRDGPEAARTKKELKEDLATKIRDLHSRLQKRRKIGRTSNIEIARQLKCDRRTVAQVLGDTAYTRTSAAGVMIRAGNWLLRAVMQFITWCYAVRYVLLRCSSL